MHEGKHTLSGPDAPVVVHRCTAFCCSTPQLCSQCLWTRPSWTSLGWGMHSALRRPSAQLCTRTPAALPVRALLATCCWRAWPQSAPSLTASSTCCLCRLVCHIRECWHISWSPMQGLLGPFHIKAKQILHLCMLGSLVGWAALPCVLAATLQVPVQSCCLASRDQACLGRYDVCIIAMQNPHQRSAHSNAAVVPTVGMACRWMLIY